MTTTPLSNPNPQAQSGIANDSTLSTPAPHVVEFRNVSKIFNPGTPREFKALEGLDLCIPDLPGKGEFKAILGPSGCGKSTMLNLLCGFSEVFPPTTGEVLVRGKPVTGPGRDRGMMFQKYSSFPNRTVIENVRLGLEINRKELDLNAARMQEIAMEWIDKVGLTPHVHKYPHQLSGGQQQRVALARTLCLKPRIILMDEPFSALDEPTRLDMQRLLVHLWHEVEATVLIVTHSVSEAVYLGDEVWVFSNAPGRIEHRFTDVHQPTPGEDPEMIQRQPAFLEMCEQVGQSFARRAKPEKGS